VNATISQDEERKEVMTFLGKDFDQAFSMLREYDGRIWEITKFSFLQLVASIGAVWTIYSFAHAKEPPAMPSNLWELISAILLIISFLFSFLGIQLILRTRVYFVRTARYINGQRGFFFSKNPPIYSNPSNYYKDPAMPLYYEIGSSELLSAYTIIVVSAFVFGFGIGLLTHYFNLLMEVPAIVLGIMVWLVMAVVEFRYAGSYLSGKDKPKKDKN
jgi:hypothetical protein